MPTSPNASRLPPWLRVKLPADKGFGCTRKAVGDLALNTVCASARCPNIFECYGRGVATFLIMGGVCTRGCAFCNITPGSPEALDPGEPRRVAEAVKRLKLSHAVITSVTRDDLQDGGASHFVTTIAAVREACPGTTVEVLIPDLQGDAGALDTVLEARPEVLNHNLETVPGCYERVRPQAVYARSLELLARARAAVPAVRVKSGLMVGVGETDEEILRVLDDLAGAGCHIVTIGQYLRPGKRNLPVARYVHPDVFEEYAAYGRSRGLIMHAAPLVRSSYNAREFVNGEPGHAPDAEATAS